MSEIAEALENYIKISRGSYKPSKDKKFYISDMGKCQRVRFLKRKGITSEFAPHVQWILKIGDLYHDFAYKALEAQGKLIDAEQTIETEHFRGRYDGLVKDSEGLAILDIKSAGKWKMEKILSGQEDEDNIAQVLTYLMIMREQDERDIKKAMLLYMNKEPNDKVPTAFKEKHIYLSKWREDKLRKEMAEMVEYWKKDEIPPCTCAGWMKNYNNYLPFCKAEDKKIQKILDERDKYKSIMSTKTEVWGIQEEGKKKKLL